MWGIGIAIAVITIGIFKLFRCKHKAEIVELPEKYWGPGEAPTGVDHTIRPFKIAVPEEVITDLKQRLAKTRPLPEPLEGAAWTYGLPSSYLKTIIDYWQNKYDWFKRQNILNEYPQFKTNIQGLDIHFYHVKPTIPKDSPHEIKVLPLLLVHGWPGSVVEFQKILPLLVTPRPGKDFVFEVIAPSLPGYGFSDAAVRPGLGAPQMAVIMKNLMTRLGFEKFYTQGGDWGSMITSTLAALYPKHVCGMHINMSPVARSACTIFWSVVGSYFPSLVIEKKYRSWMYPLKDHYCRLIEESGYFHIQATKPDTVGTALMDSPAGLAAYILEKFSTWTNPEYRFRADGGLLEKYTMDELLDNVTLYWVTNTITTSMRIYAETFTKETRSLGVDKIPILPPSAVAAFPCEIMYTPESFLRLKMPNLIRFTNMPRGGHFAAFEEPELLANDFWNFVTAARKQTHV